MHTPRPRPVPPGTPSARRAVKPSKGSKGALRSGAMEAMREHALRKAANETTDFSYKAGGD